MKAESPALSDVVSHTSHAPVVLPGVGSYECVCVCVRGACVKGETV